MAQLAEVLTDQGWILEDGDESYYLRRVYGVDIQLATLCGGLGTK